MYLIGLSVVYDWLLGAVTRIVQQIRLRRLPPPHTHTHAPMCGVFLANPPALYYLSRCPKVFEKARLEIANCNFAGPTILSILVPVWWCLVKEEHV